jgi:hypothetical protein
MPSRLPKREYSVMAESAEYTMELVFAQPSRADELGGWSDELVCPHYETRSRQNSIRIIARSLEEARRQGEAQWLIWCTKLGASELEGWWLIAPNGVIKYIFVHWGKRPNLRLVA